MPTLAVGTADNISLADTVAKLKSGLLFGCLLTAGLYNLAVFILNRRQVATLIFSLTCMLLAFSSNNFINQLLPSFNWQVAVRMEYIVFLLSVSLLVLLVNRLFPRAIHKWVSVGYVALCAIYVVIVLATDTTFFTRLLPAFQIISIAVAGYGLVRLAMQLKEKTIKNFLAFLGLAAVVVFSVYDILTRNGIYPFGVIPGSPSGPAWEWSFACSALYCCFPSSKPRSTSGWRPRGKSLPPQRNAIKAWYGNGRTDSPPHVWTILG